MKKRFVLAAGTALLAFSFAVTMPAFAETSPEIEADSSGFYAGGYGGYGWTNADMDAGPTFDVNGTDWGVFAGYQMDALMGRTMDMGISGALEVYYGWSNADETRRVAGVPVNIEKDNEWGITFRPGMTFISDAAPLGLHPYGILGYRNAEFESNAAGASGDDDFHGFELGIGSELMAFGDVGVRLDYSHVFYAEEGGIDPDENDLRLGLAYHF